MSFFVVTSIVRFVECQLQVFYSIFRLMKQLVEVQQALKQQLQSNLTHHKRMLAEQRYKHSD